MDKFKLNLPHPGSAWTQERRHPWADEGTFGVQQTNKTDDGSRKPVEPLGGFEKVVKREKNNWYYRKICKILELKAGWLK